MSWTLFDSRHETAKHPAMRLNVLDLFLVSVLLHMYYYSPKYKTNLLTGSIDGAWFDQTDF